MTVFQEQCEAALCDYLSSRGVQFRQRQVIQGENEKWIEGFVGNTRAMVFIYEDQVQLSGAGTPLNLERWDARTPSELIEMFMSSVRGIVRS